jgi:hypothetical protein
MNRYEELWTLRLHELAEYKRANGHCRVPKYIDGPSMVLGNWVSKQRVDNNINKLSAERVAKLNAIGFDGIPR